MWSVIDSDYFKQFISITAWDWFLFLLIDENVYNYIFNLPVFLYNIWL